MTYPDPFVPAFPQWDGHAITSEPMYLRGGMTLRDYFAAAALPAIISANTEFLKAGGDIPPTSSLVRDCYKIADALLKERNKP